MSKHLKPEQVAWFKEKLPAAPKVAPKTEKPNVDSNALGINTINKKGKTIDIRARLRAEGFDLGTRVQLKEACHESASVVFVIAHFNQTGETVSIETALSGVSATPKVPQEVGIDAFLAKFETAREVDVKHPGWPNKRLCDEESTLVHKCKS